MASRSFLFLQGVCSPFFARLADRLVRDGHRVQKVNFTGGDVAYWRGRPAQPYRGPVEGLTAFFKEQIQSHGITDLVLFGDRRPVHRPAIELAGVCGIRIHVFEEGYFRPYWITLERDGVNAHSRLPRDPVWYLRTGSQLKSGPSPESFLSPFRIRAIHDVVYHGASAFNPVFFPGYRTHAPFIAPVMYAGYVRRFGLKPWNERKDTAVIKRLISADLPYFLLPLQLNSDAQIRDHSDFRDMSDVMEFVMGSFARHAPSDSRLVIKNHPLDMGLTNYRSIIKLLESRFGVSGRIDYLETGSLDLLVKHARGVVTVNSTVGGVALQYGCPTIALSNPIYSLPGLTFQRSLDHFWHEASPPETELFDCFRATVIRSVQVNGGFYCSQGIEMAVQNSVPRLTAERSPLEELL